MGNEILVLRGRIAHTEALLKTLSTGIDVDIDEGRSLLDKFADKTMLQVGKLEVVIDRLCTQTRKYTELKLKLTEMKRDLGEDDA